MCSWSRASIGLALGFCLWTTSPFSAVGALVTGPVVDERLVNRLNMTYVKGVEGLQERYRKTRVRQIRVLPPDPDMQVLMSGGLTVFQKKDFPVSFTKLLVTEIFNGLPIYPVVVEENRTTRETYFYNAKGVRILTLRPALSYDPFAYLKLVYPSLFDRTLSAEDRAWQLAVSDPSRIVMRFDLLGADQVKAMAEALTADSVSRTATIDDSTLARMSLENFASVTGLVIRSISPSTNGPVLDIAWSADFTNRIEVMVRDSVSGLGWTPIPPALETAGSNSLTWTDTAASSVGASRFYRVGNADLDSDSDGLPDAREKMMYGTRLDVSDTDDDALLDGIELLDVGTDPLNPDTDSDGLRDGREVAGDLSDPLMTDTDNDILGDGEEVFGTSAWDVRTSSGCTWVNPGPQAQWLTQWAEEQVLDGSVDSALSPALPFSFVLGTYTSSSIRVSTDGYIVLDPGLPVVSPSLGDNRALPCAALGQALAVFWDDMTVSATQGIWVESTGAGSSNRVVITWSGARIDPDLWNGQGLDIQCEYAAADHSYTFRYRPASGLIFPVAAMCTVGLQGGTPDSIARIAFNRTGSIRTYSTIRAVPAVTDPRLADTDGDTWEDAWEALLGMNPVLFNSPAEDLDSDGLTLGQERVLGTDPSKYDTDGDGFSDGEELRWEMNPLSAADWSGDDDLDGLSNGEEWQHGTNPRLADTDGDNLDDWWEVNQGSDPTDMADWGVAPVETMEVFAMLQVGEQPLEMPQKGVAPLDEAALSPDASNGGETQPRGTIFQIGNIKLRARTVNETAVYGSFRLSKERTYELLVYTEEGNVEEHPVFTMISVDGHTAVPVAGGWLFGKALVRNPTAALDWRKTAPTKTDASRSYLNGFFFSVNGRDGRLPDSTEWELNETVELSAAIMPFFDGTYGWSTDVPVGLVANGSNAQVTVSSAVYVTATFTPHGMNEPMYSRTIYLHPKNHVCHWGTLTMTMPGELPLNNNDNDLDGVPDCEQNPPPANEPDLRLATLAYSEGDMLACCRKVYSGARVTLTRSMGGEKIRLWTVDRSGVYQLPYESPVEQTPWNFLMEGVGYSDALGDVRLQADITFDTAEAAVMAWSTTVLFGRIMLPMGSADGHPDARGQFVDTETPYRYDWQAVCDNTYGNGALYQIEGLVYMSPPYGYQWTLSPECGQLTRQQASLPLHIPPASIPGATQDGVLKLDVTCNQTNVGISDTRVVRVYDDHLRRDMANFTPDNLVPFTYLDGTMVGGTKKLRFTSHMSVAHAATGSHLNPYVWEGWTVSQSVTFTGPGYAVPDLGTLNRGDVVAYYVGGVPRHSQICTGNGAETWGADNNPVFWDGASYSNTAVAFCTSAAGCYYRNGNPNVDFPLTIKVHQKP